MAENIEFKARASNWDEQIKTASINTNDKYVLFQEDTFFKCAEGRLKLRELKGRTAYLIQYHRADRKGPKSSKYYTSDVANPKELKDVLARALGVERVVKKKRHLFLRGQTRIHFDRVEGLGRFIEIEVVMKTGQKAAEGRRIAMEWMKRLGIRKEDLIDVAYADLLKRKNF